MWQCCFRARRWSARGCANQTVGSNSVGLSLLPPPLPHARYPRSPIELSPGERDLRTLRQAKLTTAREFELTVQSAQSQKASLVFVLLCLVSENNTRHVFCLLSKEACLYTGADWLTSSVSRKVAKLSMWRAYHILTARQPSSTYCYNSDVESWARLHSPPISHRFFPISRRFFPSPPAW